MTTDKLQDQLEQDRRRLKGNKPQISKDRVQPDVSIVAILVPISIPYGGGGRKLKGTVSPD
jgi:hypothetical protein